jgi:hypothetical protein
MAKRPARSEADEAGASRQAPKTRNRARGARELGAEAIAGREPHAAKIQDAIAARSDATPGPEPTEEEIRARAYQMYLERGGGHGLDFDDWLRAERELKTRR